MTKGQPGGSSGRAAGEEQGTMAGAVYEKLVKILDETFGVEVEMIRAEATLSALELDSLAVAELAAMVQDEFGIKMSSADVGKGSTLAEVAAVIDAKMMSVAVAGS
ncbi:acyl carrier protein [Streptomyces sp. NBC_00237]|uniref:acyl carrier protein n=1 Tax=Streptomyces sp. NBC_00237 TaxID=2975687 RepID=UPI00224F17B9|nr:acyl carrier protein [Streptomyces sp. NBC_00237]MCX5205725.1 acyl carrier protein [Streptomyces sp. NBC_00237]